MTRARALRVNRDHRAQIGRKVVVARKYLAAGYPLSLAARASAVPKATLDRYLWRCLGLKDGEVRRGQWLNLDPQTWWTA